MNTFSYLCHVVGEYPERAQRYHTSTIKRLKAFAIAIHIPVILWGVTGYVIAGQVFKLNDQLATVIALFCSGLVYLVERLVLSVPKVWFVNIGRVVIGVVIAVIGASTVDLVIFDREIAQQLKRSGEMRIGKEFAHAIAVQQERAVQSKADWFSAQEAANCEANGTCGSKVRSVGPVYRQLARQAELLRSEYAAAQAKLDRIGQQQQEALTDWRKSDDATTEAGLLARIQALHQYVMANTAALVAWLLFFSLVLFFESMVVMVKLVFGETVDDRIDMIREQASQFKASAYLEAMTSPMANTRRILEQTYA